VDASLVLSDPEGFFERYVLGAVPVVVRGLLGEDPGLRAAEKAFSRDALLQKIGTTVWEMGEIPYEGRYKAGAGAPSPPPMELAAFVDRLIDGCADGMAASAAATAAAAAAAAAANASASTDSGHAFVAGCESAQYVFADRCVRDGKDISVRDLGFDHVPSWAAARTRPTRGSQLYLGGVASGAPMHTHQAAYNLLVFGRKAWFLAPPGHATFSLRPAREWLAERLPELRRRNTTRLLTCEQRAGDLLVVPDLWGHLTYNLETSVGLAQEFSY
jgi:hypothetical protein